MTVEERFLNAFRPAMQGCYCADFSRAATDAKGKVKPVYSAIHRSPTAEDVLRHLSGERGLLFIPVDTEGRCQFAAIDIDDYTLDIPRLLWELSKRGYRCVVARSKSGGAHIYFFFQGAQNAREVREWLVSVAADLGRAGDEIFPKQDTVKSGGEDLGNGINLPYFGDARNTALAEDGRALTLEEFLTRIEEVRMPGLPRAELSGGSSTQAQAAAEALLPVWLDSHRNDLSLELLGWLCRKGLHELGDSIIEELKTRGGGTNVLNSTEVQKRLDKGGRVPGLPRLTEHIASLASDGAAAAAILTALQKACGLQEKPKAPAAPYPIVSARDFVAMPLTARTSLVKSVLLSRSLAEIHAWRGIGKTWIAMILARCLAMAQPFLHPDWTVADKHRVLFVDGEMAAIDLQDRFKMLGPVPERLDIMVSEFLWGAEGQGLILNDLDHQVRFRATLQKLEAEGRRPEVIFFDNLSSLTSGIDENSNSEQDELLAFFRQLRHDGYTVIFVHHDGKGGVQRGASRREDFLDLVIHLEKPKPKKGAEEGDAEEVGPLEPKFRFEFTKTRGRAPNPSSFMLELVTDELGNLTTAMEGVSRKSRAQKIEQKEYVLRYIAQNDGKVTRTDVMKQFELSKTTANEHVTKLIKAGWLSGAAGPLRATPAGANRLGRLWPDEDYL